MQPGGSVRTTLDSLLLDGIVNANPSVECQQGQTRKDRSAHWVRRIILVVDNVRSHDFVQILLCVRGEAFCTMLTRLGLTLLCGVEVDYTTHSAQTRLSMFY